MPKREKIGYELLLEGWCYDLQVIAVSHALLAHTDFTPWIVNGARYAIHA